MTGTIRKALNNRYKLFKKAKTLGNNAFAWKKYKKTRTICTKIIRESKAKFWKQEFQNADNSKTFWRTVKSKVARYQQKLDL